MSPILIFEQTLLPPPPRLWSTHMLTFQYRSKSLWWRGTGLSSCRPVPSLIPPLAPTSGRERFLRLRLPRFLQPLQSSLSMFPPRQSLFASLWLSFDFLFELYCWSALLPPHPGSAPSRIPS